MDSPNDPQPSIRIEDGRVVEMDGRTREQFDFLDQFIADTAIDATTAEASMAQIARVVPAPRGGE